MRRVPSALQVAAVVLAAALALPSCKSPVAADDDTSSDQATTEVGQGVHGWPFYERDVLRDGARTDVLWPLSSVRTLSDGSVRRADILFPIGHWSRRDGTKRVAVRPLFDVETEDTPEGRISDWDVIWPFVGWRTEPDSSRSHVFPLWWQGTGETWNYRVGFPLYWSGQNSRKDWFHVWPLFGGTTTTSQSRVTPEKSTAPNPAAKPPAPAPATASAPPATDAEVVTKTSTARQEYYLWPLVLHETDTADDRTEWDVIPPFFHTESWDDGEDTRAVLWWHRRKGDDEFSLLFPLWFHSKTSVSETQVVLPVWARHKTEESDSRFYGGPLYMTYDRTDGTESSFDVIWPIFHRADRTDGQTTRLFPILWSEREGEKGYFHAWPLYGRDWSPRRTITSTIWPFFTYEDRTDGGWALQAPFPLIRFERSERHDETRVQPLFGYESDQDGSWKTSVALLFSTEREADGGRETSLFPVFSTESNADGSYEGSVGFILANWDGDGKGRGKFRLLWRLVQDEDIVVEEEGVDRSKHLFAVNPLFRHEENDRGDTSWQALFGLVKRTQRAGEVTWRFLWFLET
jgi:hypothetical protein